MSFSLGAINLFGPRAFWIAVCMVAVTPTAAAAGSDANDCLQRVLTEAYTHNPELGAQRAVVMEAKEQLSAARAGWLPVVHVTGNTGRERQQYQFTGLFAFQEQGTAEPKELTISLKQPLYEGGRTVAEINRARASVAAETARLLANEQRVLSKAAKAALQLAEYEAVEQLRTQDVADARLTVRQVDLQFASGSVTRTDTYQANARLARSIAELRAAAAQAETARADFERITGGQPGERCVSQDVIDLPTTLAEALNVALDGQPELLSARSEQETARYKLKGVRGELFPTVSLEVGYHELKDGYIPGIGTYGPKWTTDSSAKVVISIPLFEPGVYSRLSGARYGYREASERTEQVRLDVIAQVKSAWAALAAARERVREYQALVEASRDALDGVRREQQAGGRTVLDVLNAERDLLGAAESHLAAQFESGAAGIDLAEAVGTWTMDHVRDWNRQHPDISGAREE